MHADITQADSAPAAQLAVFHYGLAVVCVAAGVLIALLLRSVLDGSVVLLAAVLLAACAAPGPAPAPRTPTMSGGKTEVLWLGQAAFRITTPGGKVIVTDGVVSDHEAPTLVERPDETKKKKSA